MLYYILDVETNGLKPRWHEITQISVIRFEDRHQLTRYIRIDHPERTSLEALNNTGRTYQDLLKGDDAKSVVEACEAFWDQDGKTPEHRCLVAHNASFDKNFCHALWESLGKEFPVVCWLDTMKFVKEWAKKVGMAPKKFSLSEVLKFAKIKPIGEAHNAESDTRNTYMLLDKGLKLGVDHLSSIKRWPHITKTAENKENTENIEENKEE